MGSERGDSERFAGEGRERTGLARVRGEQNRAAFSEEGGEQVGVGRGKERVSEIVELLSSFVSFPPPANGLAIDCRRPARRSGKACRLGRGGGPVWETDGWESGLWWQLRRGEKVEGETCK